MIKALVLASTATALLMGAAVAADLPRRAAPPVFVPVPVFTWTGAYFGINAGYGFDTRDRQDATLVGVPAGYGVFAGGGGGGLAFGGGRSQEGFVGGGQIGYNYQFTPGSGLVVGLEADAQYVDFGRDRNRFSSTSPVAPGTLVFSPNGAASLDYFGTVRGRVGYAFDRTLVYGTGGFAYGSGGGREFGQANGSEDEFQTGYTYGGGVEFALATDSFLNFFKSSAVTLKIEGLYVNLENNNRNSGVFASNGGGLVGIGSPGVVLVSGGRAIRETEFVVARAGLNYKFGTY